MSDTAPRTAAQSALAIAWDELSPEVRRRLNPATPAPLKLMAARGMLPLQPLDLVQALAALSCDFDAAVASTARTSLRGLPAAVLSSVLAGALPPSVLAVLCEELADDPRWAERLLRNRATPDLAIERAVARATRASNVEIVATDHERLLRHPGILLALARNPITPGSVLANAIENAQRGGVDVRALLDGGGLGPAGAPGVESRAPAPAPAAPPGPAPAAAAAPPSGAATSQAPRGATPRAPFPAVAAGSAADGDADEGGMPLQASGTPRDPNAPPDASQFVGAMLEDEAPDTSGEAALEQFPEHLVADDPGELDDETRVGLWARVQAMNVAARVTLARMGNKEARSLLIRDSNRIVAMTVIANPRITEGEVVQIARSRTVPDEVIRTITDNRDWMKSYTIKEALAANPKTPVQTAIRLVPYLNMRDLRELARSRNIAAPVQSAARRALDQRKDRGSG